MTLEEIASIRGPFGEPWYIAIQQPVFPRIVPGPLTEHEKVRAYWQQEGARLLAARAESLRRLRRGW